MALPTIEVSDFTGWGKINTTQFTAEKLEEYITLFREEYLRLIVGDAVYESVAGQVRQKWTDLLNGVTYTDLEGKRRQLRGAKQSLIYFIYFEYVRDNFTSAQTGKVKGKSANSERATDIEVQEIARSRYNQAVRWINSSWPLFLETYETIVGSEGIDAYVDNEDGTYTIPVDTTKYIEAGDYVTIDSTEYEVTEVVANTSVTIDGLVEDLDFTGGFLFWKPFEDLEFKELEICGL